MNEPHPRMSHGSEFGAAHAYLLAILQIVGLAFFGWSPVATWLLYLADDFCLAASSWLRIAWARTRAGEPWGERVAAIVIHLFLDTMTLLAFGATLIILMPWADGVRFGEALDRNLAGENLALGLAAIVVMALLELVPRWRSDRSGELGDIDEIRGRSRILTRYLVANIAFVLAFPWMKQGAGAFAGALALVVLRAAWTLWLEQRSLVRGEKPV